MSEGKRDDAIQGAIVHVYDDIEEADNRLPNWWLATLFGAILFAAGYWAVFHSIKFGKTPVEAYTEAQMEALEKAGPVTDAMLIELSKDDLMVAAGDKLFHQNCVACHGDSAEGKIGPNLTDDYWLHGGAPTEIHHTITFGVDGKGMAAWGPQLGGGAVKQLAAYVLTLRGKHRPGKAPEGVPWHP